MRAARAARAFQKAREGLRGHGPVPDLRGRNIELAATRTGYEAAFVEEVAGELIYENSFEGASAFVFPGVAETLAALRMRKVLLGVVSDYPTDAKLESLGLGKAGWSVRVSAEDVDALKPDPAPFFEACRRAGVEPVRALHVGDRLDCDVAGARAAGMQSVLFAPPGTHRQEGPPPDHEVRSYAALRIVLETLAGK